MTVRKLIRILNQLSQIAVIDMASDEEGNSFGDIAEGLAEGTLKSTGEKVYTIYPKNCETGQERYKE